MNAIIRLSPTLVYGGNYNLVELLHDTAGLPAHMVNGLVIDYVDYIWFNGDDDGMEREIIYNYLKGNQLAIDIMTSVRNQVQEIGAYLPPNFKNISYYRTHLDGFYLLCEL